MGRDFIDIIKIANFLQLWIKKNYNIKAKAFCLRNDNDSERIGFKIRKYV